MPKRLPPPNVELPLLVIVAMEIKEFEEAPEDDDSEDEEDRDEDGFPFLIGD